MRLHRGTYELWKSQLAYILLGRDSETRLRDGVKEISKRVFIMAMPTGSHRMANRNESFSCFSIRDSGRFVVSFLFESMEFVLVTDKLAMFTAHSRFDVTTRTDVRLDSVWITTSPLLVEGNKRHGHFSLGRESMRIVTFRDHGRAIFHAQHIVTLP